VKRLARLLPLLRNSLIIVGTLAFALSLAYLLDRSTDRQEAKVIPGAMLTGNEATPAKPSEPTSRRTAEEVAESKEYWLFGLYRRDALYVHGVMHQGDAGLIGNLGTDLHHDFRSVFGGRVNRDEKEAPHSDRIVSAVLASLAEWQKSDQAARQARGEAPLTEPTVPKAYALYQQSLTVDRESAIKLMDDLLALPAEERKPLAAIAKYRRGRLTMSLDDWAALSDEATKQRLAAIRADLESVETHAREGSLDPAQISENTAYWLAYTRCMILPSERLVHLGEADFAGAVDAYLRMPQRGAANAVNSGMMLAHKLCGEGYFQPALLDEDLRMLVTIFLTSSGSHNRERQLPPDILVNRRREWLEALAAAKVPSTFAPAHVAILQLAVGRWQDCAETCATMPADDPTRRLLLSRCNLRLSGNRDVSRAFLDGCSPRLDLTTSAKGFTTLTTNQTTINPLDPKTVLIRIHGESGMLALSAGDILTALRHFDEGDFLTESFYVGECLLTIEELKEYVDRRQIPPNMGHGADDYSYYPLVNLRELLSSRLMRAGRLEEALEYVAPALRTQATNYVLLRRAAERTDVGARERADSHWRSALAVRQLGEIIQHAPFGLSWSGSDGWHVGYGYWPRVRLGQSMDDRLPLPMEIIPAGKDETSRLLSWQSQHIDQADRSERDARYASFRHALEAVRLLPDNDPAGAEILQYAGNLLKYREPKAAVPAYRMLVTRFPQTPYGQHAIAKKWFSSDRPSPPADILSK
jgi:tetratricopeptide (TPR) repeat protein